jgi:DNA helicase HerA-like ATPase
MDRECVGTAKGPGESAHEFTFVTPDVERRIKSGEFVYYEADVEGEPRQILGRVTNRVPLRLYPDSFLADPGVPPAEVAAMLGFREEPHELFEISVVVMGYYDAGLGDFINPRVLPASGSPIYIAADGMLGNVLSRKHTGDVGAAHVGSLLSRAPGAVPVVLNVRSFTGTHLAIIASTGAGKSYLASVIVEEMMMPANRASVLIVDPHGEYGTLQEMMGCPEFEAYGYRPEVRIIRPDQVRVRISSLDIGDFRYLLPNLSEKMHYYLGLAHRRVRRAKTGGKWTLGDFMVTLRAIGTQRTSHRPDSTGDAEEDGETFGATVGTLMSEPAQEAEEDPTIGALLWRVQSVLGSSKIFHDFEHMPLGELFCPGQCTVLQLNEIDQREQQVIVATLLRQLYKSRIDTEKGLATEKDDTYLPYPAFVLVEEAHNYAPANADVITTQILKTILSEGRKFGVGIGLISQRPGKLDSDVLSQCMTQCIMRIINPIDQTRIAESVESVGRDLLKELPALSKGQVIITGNSVNTPLMCRVRTRITRHGAEDPDAPARWRSYFSETTIARRERDDAFLLDAKPKGSRLWKSSGRSRSEGDLPES